MLPTLAAEELVLRLERERDLLEHPALAFDADGTLWSGDIGIELFEKALDERALREESLEALRAVASGFALPMKEEANEQARVLHRAFLDETLPDGLAFAMMAWAFAGFTSAELGGFIDDFLAEARLGSRVQEEIAPVLAWAERSRVPVHIVSASPRAAVVKAAEALRIPVSQVVAMTPAVEKERIRPWVVPPIPYGEGKVEALALATGLSELLGAFGDSGYDLAMLARARVPVAVRPKASLLARSHELPRLVSLSP